MNKKILLLMGVFCTGVIYAQVGINTENPLGTFHIDPQKNTTSTTVGVNDDILITNTGNVGIGTATPPNKLSVISTGADTGLYLPNGASSGKVLTSDYQGNGIWVSGAVQYQTMVYALNSINPVSAVTVNCLFPNLTRLTSLTEVYLDKAKDIYGAGYGWNVSAQQYIAPVTGIYRIALSLYFTTTTIGENVRAYPFCNGAILKAPGLISLTDAGSDMAGYFMGLAYLNKDDVIEIRIGSAPTGYFRYWALEGHTFLLIESL